MAICVTCWRANTVDDRTQCTNCLNHSLRKAVMSQSSPIDHGNREMHYNSGPLRFGLPGMPKAVLRQTSTVPTPCAVAPLPDVKLRPIRTRTGKDAAPVPNSTQALAPLKRSWWQESEHSKARVEAIRQLKGSDGYNKCELVQGRDAQEIDRRRLDWETKAEGSGESNYSSARSDGRSSDKSPSPSASEWYTPSSIPATQYEDSSQPRILEVYRPVYLQAAVLEEKGVASRKRSHCGMSREHEASRLLKFLLGDELPTLEIGTSPATPSANYEESHSGTSGTPEISPASSGSSKGVSASNSWDNKRMEHLQRQASAKEDSLQKFLCFEPQSFYG